MAARGRGPLVLAAVALLVGLGAMASQAHEGLTTHGVGAAREAVVASALEVLGESVEAPRPAYTDDIVAALAGELGVELREVRQVLARALRELSLGRGEMDSPWKALVDGAEGRMRRRAADRFLRELVRVGLRAAEEGDNYVVQVSVRHAAREAGVPEATGRAYLQGLIAQAVAGRGDAAGGRVGVVVRGRTLAYTRDMEQLLLFLGTRDEEEASEAVREVHRFVVPRVVGRLPRAEEVEWAVRERDLTPLLTPDVTLAVEVEQVRFHGRGGRQVPCMDLKVELRTAGESRDEPRALSVCDEGEEGEEITGLLGLYDLAAEAVCEAAVQMLRGGLRGEGR